MKKKIMVKDIEELPAVAESLLNFCKYDRIFAFYGEIGAGKTTFIKAICGLLGIKDNVVSPSFAIVNEYKGEGTVYHMDFYRLKDEQEAIEIGLEEYFGSDAFVFIEWPSKIDRFLPESVVRVDIQVTNGSRKITITRP